MQKYPFKLSELDKLIEKYFSDHLGNHPELIPDTESLASYLGITRNELNSLSEHKLVGRTVQQAKTRIASEKKQLAFRGKLPPTVLAFDLRNDHGYRDKPEETPQTTIVLRGSSDEWGD